MTFYFLTLFPEMIRAYFGESVMNRAVLSGAIDLRVIDIRDYAQNKHNRVDDYPYGGGAGMVIAAPPVLRAVRDIEGYADMPVIMTSPAGKPFTQKDAKEIAEKESVIFLCGHYEGIDQRAIDAVVTQSYSIGDYVLTGGELPALVMADAASRHLPGVLGNSESLREESFENSLLEYPQYTRPETVEGVSVPPVLLSGNHAEIDAWRKARSIALTQEKRPDLYEKYLQNQNR